MGDPASATPTGFRALLRRFRLDAGLSQLDLAAEAGISQRHLSFLESGRSRPGRDVALALAGALALPPPSAGALLGAAGFAGPPRARRWPEHALAPVKAAAAQILAAHMPYPAVLIDEAGDVLDANPAFEAALGLLGDAGAMWQRTHGGLPRNLLRLTHHPAGPAAAMVNFEEVARATLGRAALEAPQSERLRGVLDEIAAYPNIDPAWLASTRAPTPPPVTQERYRVRGGEVAGVVAVTTTIGAPADPGAGSFRIESFFPVDESSRAIIAGASARGT